MKSSTVYEALTDSKGLTKGMSEEFYNALERSEIIFIDNVAEYFMIGTDQEFWDLEKDFPNIAPPFADLFLEFRIPKLINLNGVITKHEFPLAKNVKCGVLIHSIDVRGKEEGKFDQMGVRWISNAIISVCADGKLACPLGLPFMENNTIGIDGNGKIAKLPNGKTFFFKSVPKDAQLIHAANKDNTFLEIALLAISFMHCKNVELVPKGQGTYQGKRNRNKPSFRYHILEIEPMKKVLRTEGESEKTGLKRALHICRGHFKDYSKGKGLFGRYQDIFWWDSQVRGDISAGLVNKDYAVKAPKE